MNFYNKYKKTNAIFFHIIAWILYLLAPYLITDFPAKIDIVVIRIMSSIILIGYFYLNYLIFIPNFFDKKKYLLFAFFTLISLITVIAFNAKVSLPVSEYFFDASDNIKGRGPNMFTVRLISIFILFFLSSTALRLFGNWKSKEKQLKESENEQIKSELLFLKLQISPHFLFNTLNSIYSLAVSKSDQTPEIILKLSDLMRYMIYTSSEKLVNLNKEIVHIRSYIELQKLRLFETVKIDFETNVTNSNNKIEPMLLIPFVENAFKFGVSYSEKSNLKFSINVKNEDMIFEAENSVFKKSNTIEDDSSGLGLMNVKRRLELLYPQKYELKISEIENKYKVSLKIKLKKS